MSDNAVTVPAVELGFITYGNAANVYWVHPRSGERHMRRRLIPGDEGTVWLTAGLGHRFVVVEEASGRNAGRVRGLARRHPLNSGGADRRRRAAPSSGSARRTHLRKFEQNRANQALKGPRDQTRL